jgi:hypothetical protein
MSRIVHELVQTELVPDHERGRFDGIVAAARRLLNSRWAEISVLIVAYLHAFILTGALTLDAVPTWDIPLTGGARALSLAGWWRILVSLPLYLTLFYGWLWRLLVWARFLWQVARLDLKLMPSHPDRAGGLGFLAHSAPVFSLLAFAMTATVAGKIASRVMYEGVALQHFTRVIVALVALVLVLFLGPLLPLSIPLMRERRRGLLEYGALATGLGHQFERQWLQPAVEPDAEALKAPDFSATTDLFQIVANVREMRIVLVDRPAVLSLVVMALLPFFPVVLTEVPLKQILQPLGKLLLG